MRIGRADGDDVRAVAGAANAAIDEPVNIIALRVFADHFVSPPVVACAGDDDDTRVDRMRDRYAQRVFAPRLAHRRAKAHVDDVDAIAITILDRPVDGAQHTARRARTML